MQSPLVAPATDSERAVATLVLAFGADSASRWAFPEPAQYLAHFPTFVRLFGGGAFAHGTAYETAEYTGVALWLPPSAQPDEAGLAKFVERSIPAQRQPELLAVLEQMGSQHPPEPHWYLSLLGVDPTRQGQGHGSALLAHTLARCDADHLPAYLETSNPANLLLYRRHGFVEIGAIQVGASPTFWPMLRRPR